uniref:N-acetyltransferase domain-containing protein n=2 Tax=Corethron hystrix TaxID=216773 RepID=A0A7S1G113_9STRA|mmetsp:Transcript_8674/g.19066  ORF Transcript_8674/g.19066 Transcript_8674/m.19066 type:complete len:310 (+) Transcript_8674:344-1273(+)|eukprot:CAMPEP_0113313974 /NCGR_PEP_ID=MMETSP0010_2-20120614/10207_1 /TAXON_ID=216773 ORGANISM="Corethron hystrix, Strain 308" /NCGR_SAMPLE_ID=MMETSP0010_2 /ASSEMBLY_ACC=CAM_ASM_000155 /LENGTH=309 /DNA_ID=CAMNT_0000170141 /DNA_START=343 /DNA_END=1272 /DNA_ORIENTATION=- /assembly_acc=CAM_ASM_000155
MKRPGAFEANFLCLAFFRVSHAFASDREFRPHVLLRVARRTDVQGIQSCNLANLPENYHTAFYVNHLRDWPELALVAERITSPTAASSSNHMMTKTASRDSPPATIPVHSSDEPSNVGNTEIIGYVLGKVREEEAEGRPGHVERIGHVTSLAIMSDFRRQGLAGELMRQLHYNMQRSHSADGVGLHVRVSNVAATQLYSESMGYRVAGVIKGYYQDGEDAYLMRKDLLKTEQQKRFDEWEDEFEETTKERKRSNRVFGKFRNRKVSRIFPEIQDTLRLPRSLTLSNPEVLFDASATSGKQLQKIASGAQ